MPQGAGAASKCAGSASGTCEADEPRVTTMLYLRQGGLLCTEKPSMEVVTKGDWDHVKEVHEKSQHFHSDFAHTDYTVGPGSNASWCTAPLDSEVQLQALRVSAVLWFSTSAAETDVTVSLLKGKAGGAGAAAKPDGDYFMWSELCRATANTQFREGKDTPLLLPGKGMMAAGANGGYAVAVPLELELAEKAALQPGDVLRVEISGGGASKEHIDHRIWHNPKWASTMELVLEPSTLDLKWVRPASSPVKWTLHSSL
eukprot:gnl/TRDRNA2_/TRDRNA2_125863_c0_seq1.p1 gnl/TRDRNA2_/TRDRNA2_125863_c0~~gnl/TRDRNA2_/TRDRNA2_125863_c0_seq1.p1  ORF type:complete len:257 (-),score=48.60 gnl/TRDRNA2_/TRDRNA2_125863_c0_seq1:126-896(-)